MSILKSKRERYHRLYKKEGTGLWWYQYEQSIYRIYRLWGFKVWSRLLARADRPTCILIKKACGL